MSRVRNGKLVIEKEDDEKCECCGKIAELRPYGKNGANVCFECAMKDEKTAKEMFNKRIEGINIAIVRNKED